MVVSSKSGEAGLPSRLVARSFGEVEISRILTPPQCVERRRSDVASNPGDKLFVNVPLTSATSARQAGRRAALQPYDLVIVDSAAPFELAFDRPLHQVSVCMPHDLLVPRLPHLDVMTATRVDGAAGIGAVASQMLRTLATMKGPIDRNGARALGQQAAELVALSLGGALPTEARRSRELILHAARDEIERSLADPHLSPGLVADRVGVSVSYLHRLFTAQGLSFGRWLLSRRLARCRADLIDPGLAQATIAGICVAHGFTDPSYFARAFRAAYGETPRHLRERTRGRVSEA